MADKDSGGGGGLTWDQKVLLATAKLIESANGHQVSNWKDAFGKPVKSVENSDPTHVRKGDLTISGLEDHFENGLMDPNAPNPHEPGSTYGDIGDPYPRTQLNDLDDMTKNFSTRYQELLGALDKADKRMSIELGTTAANLRKMNAAYAATEDVNKRDMFGVHFSG